MKKKSLTVLAMTFILAGITLTLENLGMIPSISRLWPFFLIMLGTGFTILFFQGRRKDPVLIWLGSFLGLIGCFFLYLNYTAWTDLSYLWTIFLAIIGLSFLAAGLFTKKKIIIYVSILFILLFLALFMVFSVNLKLWPLSLVVFGLSLLLIEYFPSETIKKKGAEH